jgi:hypothetical protein
MGYADPPLWVVVGRELAMASVPVDDDQVKSVIRRLISHIDDDDQSQLLINYALASDQHWPENQSTWDDILKERIFEKHCGFQNKGGYPYDPKSPRFQEIWNAWQRPPRAHVDPAPPCGDDALDDGDATAAAREWEREREAAAAAQQAEDERLCSICMDKPRDARWSSCGHSCFCFACLSTQALCPLCRAHGQAVAITIDE